jgi:hypothetical protein
MKVRIVFWDVLATDVSEVRATSIIRDAQDLIPDDGGSTHL